MASYYNWLRAKSIWVSEGAWVIVTIFTSNSWSRRSRTFLMQYGNFRLFRLMPSPPILNVMFLTVFVTIWVCETGVVHHLVSTGLHCAPSTCVVHHQPALCTMVHKGGAYVREKWESPPTFLFWVPPFHPPANIKNVGHSLSISSL